MSNKNKVGFFGDVLISSILLMFIIFLSKNYNMDYFTNGTANPARDGGFIIALIDQLFGKKITFLFLYYFMILFLLIACKDYLRDHREKTSYKKWQIFYFRFIKYLSIFSAIIVFIGLPLYALSNQKYYANQIDKYGRETIIYISENVEQRRGHYVVGYFYANNEKHTHKIRYVSATNVGKFMKVKYLPESPNRFRVDRKLNVPIDSVYKYFPKGKNPFEKEIQRLKEREKNNVIMYEMK